MAKLGQQFPSATPRQNYARLRLEMLEKGKMEFDIMAQFILEERELYKALDWLEVQKPGVSKYSSTKTSYTCNRPRHQKNNCPEKMKVTGRTANVSLHNLQQAPRNCPACQALADLGPFFRRVEVVTSGGGGQQYWETHDLI